jgi:hypothetical protein
LSQLGRPLVAAYDQDTRLVAKSLLSPRSKPRPDAIIRA